MKKIIISIFILIPIVTFAKNKDSVDVYFKNEIVGSYTIEQFESLVSNNEYVYDMMEAEKSNRVIIELVDETFVFTDSQAYKGFVYIKWLKENEEVLKSIKLELTLNLDDPKLSFKNKMWNIYKNISAASFPVAAITIIILIICL